MYSGQHQPRGYTGPGGAYPMNYPGIYPGWPPRMRRFRSLRSGGSGGRFSSLGQMTPEQEAHYNATGELPEVVVTPEGEGWNAVTTQWPYRTSYTFADVSSTALIGLGFILSLAGTVNLFRKRYAGRKLRYAGGYMILGGMVSGLGMMVKMPSWMRPTAPRKA